MILNISHQEKLTVEGADKIGVDATERSLFQTGELPDVFAIAQREAYLSLMDIHEEKWS